MGRLPPEFIRWAAAEASRLAEQCYAWEGWTEPIDFGPVECDCPWCAQFGTRYIVSGPDDPRLGGNWPECRRAREIRAQAEVAAERLRQEAQWAKRYVRWAVESIQEGWLSMAETDAKWGAEHAREQGPGAFAELAEFCRRLHRLGELAALHELQKETESTVGV